MAERTVVVCPDCQNAWIVKDRPNRTRCSRCRSRHTFKNLKKFYQTDDKEAGRRALAQIQAQVNNLEEEFQRAAESKAIDADARAAIDDDEYLERMGVMGDEIKEAAERAEDPRPQSKSQQDIVQEAVTEQDAPGRDDVSRYAEEHDLNGEKALDLLDKYREKGDVIGEYEGPFRLI